MPRLTPSANPSPGHSPSAISSIVFGAISMALDLVAEHFETLRGAYSSALLNAAERWGLVRPPHPYGTDEARAPGLLAFTDETGLNALVAFAAYLALCSIGLSLWAEHRGQSNLYLSAGFVCGTGALFLVHQGAGMTAGVLGTAWVLGKRRWQRGRPLP
ncbi:hypothetical protein AACH06_18935 [Ideonella sp. DXS29W]|uniref:Uncharacterized protein n=1 Tax=Ideonella lacteola TaxID=2984193 RepID=A0ABU9BSQ8_9BURK